MGWKVRNVIAFMDKVLSIQKLKTSFVFSSFVCVMFILSNGPSILVEFVDWMGYGYS